MTLVKPPSFNELVKIYGSPRAAVLHLTESGYTPEDIAWKMDVPYHTVRLYLKGFEPTKPALFHTITQFYERLASLRSKKGKETELATFFKKSDLGLEMKTRLSLGRIVDESLGIGPAVVERAISVAAGATPREVKRLLVDYGEYGEVAALLLRPRKPRLTLQEVYESIRLLPQLDRVKERDLVVASLLQSSSPQEAKYLVRLLLFDLKLGYQQRNVMHAVAKAYGIPTELVENACAIIGLTEGLMLAPKGVLALEEVKLRPGQFLKPQLAQLYSPEKVEYPVLAEYKLDGSRLQVHKWGSRVWLFSRRGLEKTNTLPEIVKFAGEFKAQRCVVDSEVIAVDPEGQPLPFQRLLERTVPSDAAPAVLEEKKRKTAVTILAFDLMYLNGRDLMGLPLSQRRQFLVEVVPHQHLVQHRTCQDEVELMAFYEEALRNGYEGIVVKNLNTPYALGQRTHSWLKLKPERDTIDCTLVKALFGKGQRTGLYSSFEMAVKDPTEKKLYTIGRVSNLPDRVMVELRNRVEDTKVSQDDEGVLIRPTIVVEVTFQEIQNTEDYTSGFALRVPKVVRFRLDKAVEEIDSLEKMQQLYELQYERQIPQNL